MASALGDRAQSSHPGEAGARLCTEGPIVFVVSDNDPGMDPARRRRVPEPFQRLPGCGQYDGHGLRPAPRERVEERHRGTVWIADAAGGSCAVDVMLAATPPGSDVSRQTRPDPQWQPSRTAVLLVEDDPGDVRMVLEALGRTGPEHFHVTHVATLADAVDTAHRTPIDCVLLDLTLPDAVGLDGLGLIRRLHPAIPVVVLTACDESLALAALGGGAQDCLVKDRDLALVGRAVRYAVARAGADGALRERDARLAESHRLARMGTWQWDVVRGTVTLSRELTALTGLPFTSLTEDAAIAAVHPNDRAGVSDALALARRVGGAFSFDARLLTPRGEMATRHVGYVRRAAYGAATLLFGTMQDVTVT